MGFCLFNNVAVTAAALAERGERVLVVDYDAHHGNGTQDIFWADGRVAYASFHQYPLYPGTGGLREVGVGDGRGTTINLPLPAGRHRRRLPGRGRRGARAVRGRLRAHLAAHLGRLRRPPGRPDHRPRACRPATTPTSPPRCSSWCRPAGASCSSRAATTSTPSRRPRRPAWRPWSGERLVPEPPTSGGPGRDVVAAAALVRSELAELG